MSAPCLLFDLDGTLVDTDRVHLVAFNRVLEPYGKRIDAAFYATNVMGFPNDTIMERLLPELPVADRMAVADHKEATFRAMAGDLEPLPGVVALLDWADGVGCPCGVVTNAPRANAEMVLNALGLAGRFRTVVIGDEVERSKPDPLPYLTGLSRLGAAAARSVAFEDSRSGATAAVAAGIATVGITTSLKPEVLAPIGVAATAPHFEDEALLALVRSRILG